MAQRNSRRDDTRRGKGMQSRVEKRKPKPKSKKKPQNSVHARQDSTRGPRQSTQSTWPYGKRDRILLLGEGDFSFAVSLARAGGCENIMATCFDSESEMGQKYPHAAGNVEALRKLHQRVMFGVDATKPSAKAIRRPPLPPRAFLVSPDIDEAEQDETARDSDEAGVPYHHKTPNESTAETAGVRGWDIISFNFPHVGGKSTDVNRQVRYNQSLLVSFFKAACPLLTPPSPTRPTGGAILVTLFEGEPYTLWNVKDLGRHSGLRAERSWRFDFNNFPGYEHARTLGVIDGGGGWKGKNRAARTYAFVSKDAPASDSIFSQNAQSPGRRPKKGPDDEDDDGSD